MGAFFINTPAANMRECRKGVAISGNLNYREIQSAINATRQLFKKLGGGS